MLFILPNVKLIGTALTAIIDFELSPTLKLCKSLVNLTYTIPLSTISFLEKRECFSLE